MKRKAVNLNCYCCERDFFITVFSFTWITIQVIWLHSFLFTPAWWWPLSRATNSGFGSRWKKILRPPPNKGGPDKNLYTNSEKLAVSSASSEKVKLWNRQVMILPGKVNHMRPIQASGPVPDWRISVNWAGFHPHVSIVLKGWNM